MAPAAGGAVPAVIFYMDAPGFREGKVFGDFPQVAIGDQLRSAEEAIAAGIAAGFSFDGGKK